MSEARQCDFTGEFYKPESREYLIVSKDGTQPDIGPTLYSKILALLEGKQPKKSEKRKHNWSPEKRKAAARAMSKRTTRAKEIMKETGCSYKKAYNLACGELKQEKDSRKARLDRQNANSMSRTERDNEYMRNLDTHGSEENKYKCACCGEGEVKGPHEMCEQCSEHFGQKGEVE